MDQPTPLIAQLWGKNPDNFRKTAAELYDMGFAGVDLNMGCPVHKAVKQWNGASLMREPEKAAAPSAEPKGAASPVPAHAAESTASGSRPRCTRRR